MDNYYDKTKDEILKSLHELEKKYDTISNSYNEAIAQLANTRKGFDEKEAVYKTLFDASKDAIMIMENEIFVECNQQTLTIFKCKNEDIIGKSPLDFSPEYQENGELSSTSAREKVKQALNGTPQFFEWIHRKLDGELFEAEISLFRIVIKNLPYLQAIVRDISFRKRAEEELRIKNLVFNSAISGSSIADKNGNLLFVNQSFLEIWGYSSEEEVIGKPISHFIEKDQETSQILSSLNQFGQWEGEYRAIRRDESTFTAYSQASILRDKVNNIIGYQSAVIDVSQRNKAIEDLAKSEEKYKMLIDFATDAFFHGDENGNCITVNNKAIEITGYSMEELLKMAISDLFPKEVLEQKPLRYDKLKGGATVKSERQIITKKGELVSVEMYTKQMPDGTFQSFFKDITERKKVEENYKESEEKYRNMVEMLPNGVIIHQEGKIVFANDASFNILNATKPEQVIGKNLFEFVHPDYHAIVIERIKGSLVRHTKQESLEEVFLTLDKKKIFVNVIAIPIQYLGKPSVMVVATDITKQKQIGLELKESEERKKALLNAIPDMMLVFDQHGFFIDYHSNILPFYVPPSQFIGKKISEIFLNDISEKTNFYLQKLFETGQMQVFGYEMENNGETCYYESRLVMQGTDKALAIIRDITRQKNSENALIENEERFRRMLNMLRLITDNANDFLWAKDMDNKYIFANKTICERLLFAKDTQEPIGKDSEFFHIRERESHPEDPTWYTFGENSANNDLIVQKEKKSMQFDEYGNVKGKFLFLDVHKSPIWDNNGNMIGVVGTARDVTKEKEFELKEEKFVAALIESENRYRTVVSNTPIISFVVDNKGIFTLSDGKGLIKLGLKPGQIVGLSVYDVYKDYPIIIESVNKCLNGKSIRQELTVDGIVFDVFYSPIFDNDGNVAKVIGVATDITERKQVETLLYEKNIAYENQNIELKKAKEKAEESDQLKSSFLANLSHEIRTPMNAIMGFSDLLKKPEFSADRRENFISIIHKSGNYLLSIINDIVEISKIDAGQVNINKTPVDINALLFEMYQSAVMTLPKDKNIGLELQLPEEKMLKRVFTDPVKLRQILLNLINNAIKFTETGSVTFGYEKPSKGIISFFVADTGIGIEKIHHQIIFERFRQIDGDMAIRKGGSGLGLAISKAYAEMLGGKLSFTSEPNKGSIFKFYVPMDFENNRKRDLGEPEIKKEPFQNISSDVILIVEDDDINYFFFEEILSDRNYLLKRAGNGKEAIEMATNELNIKLVLMDIKMPIMNGYDALKGIKMSRPELPVIAQTSYALFDDVVKINAAGFDGYISKPIVKEKLIDLIDKNLK
jgi:PAS domain S-box-containing protein